MNKFIVLLAIALVISTGYTVVTYQAFFGGFTDLHNYSKTPGYVLTGTMLYPNGTLDLQVANEYGPDTYGGFIVLVQVLNPSGSVVYEWNASQLGAIPKSSITNEYPLHPAHPDGFALVVPLGQNASVVLHMPFSVKPGNYTVRVYDVDGQYSSNGINFETEVTVA
ncbi:MAG: Aa3-type terminal oxidase [Nitrososphaerota archaeon]|jgi:thiosulfate dehydrogenase [quinone] small subunit|nr:Aa3-type terminal oxidase [Nitrososphaerota archaeon]